MCRQHVHLLVGSARGQLGVVGPCQGLAFHGHRIDKDSWLTIEIRSRGSKLKRWIEREREIEGLMRDSRRSQKDSLRTCALQHKTLNQIRNSGKLLQASLYVCNNLFINCSLFDLASTCFTYCRKNFKKFVFLASPKTWFVTVHPPYKNLVPEIKVLLGRWWGGVLPSKSKLLSCCFLIGVVVP